MPGGVAPAGAAVTGGVAAAGVGVVVGDILDGDWVGVGAGVLVLG
jgi:hypothetical protein